METADLPSARALPAQMRMVSYGQQAAKDKFGFEAIALAASIVGKCKPCIVSHVDELKNLGMSDEQFRDLAKLVAAVHSISKIV